MISQGIGPERGRELTKTEREVIKIRQMLPDKTRMVMRFEYLRSLVQQYNQKVKADINYDEFIYRIIVPSLRESQADWKPEQLFRKMTHNLHLYIDESLRSTSGDVSYPTTESVYNTSVDVSGSYTAALNNPNMMRRWSRASLLDQPKQTVVSRQST